MKVKRVMKSKRGMKSKRIKSNRVKSKGMKSKRMKSNRVKSKRKKSYSATGIVLGIGIPIVLGLGCIGYYYYKKVPENQLRHEARHIDNLQPVINYDENAIIVYLSKIFDGNISINRDITLEQLQQYMKDILPNIRDIQARYRYRAAAIAIKRLQLNNINDVNTDYEGDFITNPPSVGGVYITRNYL